MNESEIIGIGATFAACGFIGGALVGAIIGYHLGRWHGSREESDRLERLSRRNRGE